MIKELKLSNFRVFDDEVTIRFRPITIIIGRNNAGKSSIIKFLLMLRQSLEDKDFLLKLNGPQVKLGTSIDIKNQKTKKEDLRFSLRVADHQSISDSMSEYLETHNYGEISELLEYEFYAKIDYPNDKGITAGGEQVVEAYCAGKEILMGTARVSARSPLLSTPGTVRAPNTNGTVIEGDTSTLAGQSVIGRIKNILGQPYFISGLREFERSFDMAEFIAERGVGSRGQYTLHQLQHNVMEHGDLKHRATVFQHAESILGIKDFQLVSDPSGIWRQYRVTNKETQASNINVVDFGFGVSQCLPILVQGALMSSDTQLIVEQPESQVHPTAQLAMGSFFVDLWRNHKVGSIIETHSHNILLRIRNHVASKHIEPEDVSVAYVECEDGQPIVWNLDLNEDGTLEEGLPMEFFSGSIEEVVRMGMMDE